MPKAVPTISLLTEEQRQAALEAIIVFFQDERGEQIGLIAAEDVLEMFLQDIGPQLYNKGVEDAKKVFKENSAGIELNLDMLIKK